MSDFDRTVATPLSVGPKEQLGLEGRAVSPSPAHNKESQKNQISDISPLAGLTRLEKLYLGTNHIASIGKLSGPTALRVLVLLENQVTIIAPPAALTNLKQGRPELAPRSWSIWHGDWLEQSGSESTELIDRRATRPPSRWSTDEHR